MGAADGRWRPLRRLLWVLGLLLAAPLARAQTGLPPPDATTVPLDSARGLQVTATPLDSALLLDLTTRRVGLATYMLRTNALGRIAGPSAAWRVRYGVQLDWLGTTVSGADFFIRQETRTELAVARAWGRGGQGLVEPFVQHYQNPAIRISISTLGARAGWTARLPGPDTTGQLRVVALVGLRRDVRRQYADAGPALGADLLARYRLPGTAPQAAPLYLTARVLHASLGPRAFDRLLAEAAWETAVLEPAVGDAPAGVVRVQAGYRLGRTDDYQASNVQRIVSDTITARVSALWPVTPVLTVRSDNTLLLPARQFTYQPVPATDAPAPRLRNFGYRQREVQLREEARVQWRRLQGSGQFQYTERQRDYEVRASRLDSTVAQLATAARQEKLKDIRERTTAWLTNLEWVPTPRLPGGPQHSFNANTTAQLLRLDTPSDQNDQDRDEVTYQGRLQWATRWGPTFRTSVAVAAEWRQFAFIKASQSAENYTDRVVAYEPGFRWGPGRFSWQADFQLRAIYQVRALASEQGRNRATRLLQWQQEWAYRLPARSDWRLSLSYQRRESRFAQLTWPAFRESPLDTTVANDYLLAIRRALPTRAGRPRGLTHAVRLGYRFFEQRVHQRAGLAAPGAVPMLIFRRDYTWQHGPEVRYERTLPLRGLRFNAAVWLQRISTFSRYRQGQGFFTGVSATPDDLARRANRSDPYFEVTLQWRWR